jgi:phage gp36-like protein
MPRYAEIADLDNFGITGSALASLSTAQKNAALDRASDDMDSYIGNVYALPLTDWGNDVRSKCCDIAVYHLLARRGFNPDGKDQIVQDRYDNAIDWLKDIAAGRARLLAPAAVDQTPTTYDGGAYVVTRPRRGWGS